jgi:hypothetical protein
LRDARDLGRARQAFEAALTIKPDYIEARAALASLLQEMHELAESRRLAESVLVQKAKYVLARLTLARLDLRAEAAQPALDRLSALLAETTLTPRNRIVALGLRGQALDRLARHREAFSAFAEANALQRTLVAGKAAQAPALMSPVTIARLSAFFGAEDIAAWTPAPEDHAAPPVFFVGFPRSGTTLLEQILAAHPQIATVEEQDILAAAVADLVMAEDALNALRTLSAGDIERRRSLYRRGAAQHASLGHGEILVDKLPLNTILLGPAYRLFPSAKIIFALRDPRDVVLSCFQQTFDMNAAMFEFLTLEGAARYYDSVMRLFEIYRARLPLKVHLVRYEDLLADFEGKVRGLLAFLDLPWDEAIRGYRDRAKKKVIRTPSASQVVQPLYTSARGKWRHYRAELEAVLPLLEPWVRAFGYDPT